MNPKDLKYFSAIFCWGNFDYKKFLNYFKIKKFYLTGSPRVIQGSDVIKGYKVTLRENLEMVEVDDSASSFTIKKKQK